MLSLVLETNNLEGGDADAAKVSASLERLLLHLRKQVRPLQSLQDFVITHGGLPASMRSRLDEAIDAPITWVQLPDGTNYYQAKNVGFSHTRGEVVVFADADCVPEEAWLDQLLLPFDDPEVQVVAGRTCYRPDLLGTAATTIDFMYFPSTLGEECSRNFYANNVAFRRQVFEEHSYEEHAMYRGHCVVLGMQLYAAGIPVTFVPEARTIHRFPDSIRELVQLRLLRGRDTCELTPALLENYWPSALPAAKLGPLMPLTILAGRLGCSLRSLNRQDMPPVHRSRWMASAGAIAAVTAIDAFGALSRGLGLDRRAAPMSEVTLSYHQSDEQIAA
jgi:hypothetical protein